MQPQGFSAESLEASEGDETTEIRISPTEGFQFKTEDPSTLELALTIVALLFVVAIVVGRELRSRRRRLPPA